MARPLVISESLSIPPEQLQFTFARSSGPGGQNVNKVNTKAVLRWQPAASPQLPPDVCQRFLQRYARRINHQGEIILSSDQYREQKRNIAACRDKLRQLIVGVLAPPTRRRKTKPSRASVERRLQSKRHRAQRKQQRRYRPGNDQ